MFVAVGLVLVAAMTAALSSLTLASHRAAEGAFDHEIAKLAAESGVAFMYAKIVADYSYLEDLADLQEARTASPTKTPLRSLFDDTGLSDLGGSLRTIDMLDENRTLEGLVSKIDMGRGDFQFMSVVKDAPDQWTTLVVGSGTEHDYRLGVTIGPTIIDIPNGLTLGGTANPADIVISAGSRAEINNYTPDGSSSPKLNANGTAITTLNGSVLLNAGSDVYGDLTLTGTVSDPARVSGTVTEGAPSTIISSVDSLVLDHIERAKTVNDNLALTTVFGANWIPIASADNYGDLYVSGGNYTIPAGTYKVRRFEVSAAANITFDTSGGPIVFIYVGDPGGTDHRNDLMVTDRATVSVDPGGTDNRVQLIMGPSTDLRITQQGTFGLNLDMPDSAGALQILGWSQGTPTGQVEIDGASTLFARVHTAGHEWVMNDRAYWFGSGFQRTLSLQGSRNGFSRVGIDESAAGTTVEDYTNPIIHAIWDAN